MRALLVLAVLLCAAGAAVGLAFSVLTGMCGAREVAPNQPDEPPNESNCVPLLHPVGPITIMLGVGSAFAVAKQVPVIAVVLGTVLFVFGFLYGLSAGFYGIGAGVLVLAGALVGLVSREKTRLAAT